MVLARQSVSLQYMVSRKLLACHGHWVLFKLLINVVASIVLLLYMETLGFIADLAAQATWSSADLGVLRSPSPMLHATLALMLLVAAATLSVYKPLGRTRYGWRKQRELLAGT